MSQIIRIHGMVDPHVHLRGMNWAHKGTFASETAAAIAGGYTAILDMPNTSPATLSPSALAEKIQAIDAEAYCDWGLYFGASASNNADVFPRIFEDICGLKIYNNETTGNLLIENQSVREAMYAAWTSPKPIAVHAEGKTMLDILALVRQYRRHTHFVHVCSAEEISYLRTAKEEGLPISIGVTPHHLYLSQDDLPRLGAYGLMKPELKSKADQEALWRAIADGVVDVIESDHAPHSIAEKDSGQPPFGVPGLETNLPLMLLAVQEKRLSLEQVILLVSSNVHRIFGLHPAENTYTLIEIGNPYTLSNDKLFTKCRWTPFEGMRVDGKIREVWIRGTQVFNGEVLLTEAGFGQRISQGF